MGMGVTLLIWAVSRAIYYGLGGLRFNTDPAFTFWQNVDPVLLRTDLWRSLWNLHMQPPAYNLLIGILLKISPESFAANCWALHLAIGVILALFLYWLMRWFGISQTWATVLTGFFITSPACVLFESTAVYEYPIMLLLLGGTVALARFAEAGQMRHLWIFGGCLFGLMMIRNLFHAGYTVIIGVSLWWMLAQHRRKIAQVFVPLLLLTFGLYLKNQILFGRFTPSTWMGMQTGFITSHQLNEDEADALIAMGLVTPLIKIRPFSPIEAYAAFLRHPPARTGVPVLDEPQTSRGYSNFNALAYLEIHDQYVANSKVILQHDPIAYVRSLLSAWFSYFLPASDLPYYFAHQTPAVRQWERTYSQVVLGQIYRTDQRSELNDLRRSGEYLTIALHTGVLLVVALPLLVSWGAYQLLRRRRRWGIARFVVLGFMLLTIGAQAMIGNSLACCETNRYRFPMEPFFVLLAGLAVNDAAESIRTVRRQRQVG